MRIVCLQHVDYEGPELIAEWAAERGHDFETVVPLLEQYPDPARADLLVVMGGPMGAYEDATYPWLGPEIAFIRAVADAGGRVLGVCLGAQLLARALGGGARPHAVRELGWFPVTLTDDGRSSRVLTALPDGLVVGLWHGDTYDLPAGVETAMMTDACANQAFEAYGGRVVGLQFHLEWTREALGVLAQRHPDWFETGGPFVQTLEQFTEPGAETLAAGRAALFALLDRMEHDV